MRIDEYQQLAMRTSTEGHDRVENGCLGLIGESGEVVDAVKKWRFQSGDMADVPTVKLVEECGDVLWYCAELAKGLHTRLGLLYERYGREYFPELCMGNASMSLAKLSMRLTKLAVKPYCDLYEEHADIPYGWKIERASIDIAGIIITVEDILTTYCGSTLSEAMEQNIAKLLKRYPDGFDPERSLNRAQ